MKRLSIIILQLFFIFSVTVMAQEENVDWDKIEARLYEELKAKGTNSDAEIHQAIGYAFLKTENQWERARVRFKKAVKLDPSLYSSWYCLGILNPDTKEGRGYFKKAIEAKPDYPPPYYWLAYSYCRNRMDKKAVPVFEKYLEVAKGDLNEQSRIKTAKGVLEDLYAGKEGENISKLRKQYPKSHSELR